MKIITNKNGRNGRFIDAAFLLADLKGKNYRVMEDGTLKEATHDVTFWFTRIADGDWEESTAFKALLLLNSASAALSAAQAIDELENPVEKVISISKDYDAVVKPEGIEVGCQKITWEKFDELVAATKKIRS